MQRTLDARAIVAAEWRKSRRDVRDFFVRNERVG